MTIIIVILAVIAAIFVLPYLLFILRWVLFIPIAFAVGVIFNLIDMETLLVTVFSSHISPTLGLIFGIPAIFIDYLIVTFVAKFVCPSSIIGWTVSFGLCIIKSVRNLIIYHSYVLFPFGLEDPTSPIPPIIWWHVVLLFIASLGGAWIGKGIGESE